jgi:hypothetical protein
VGYVLAREMVLLITTMTVAVAVAGMMNHPMMEEMTAVASISIPFFST